MRKLRVEVTDTFGGEANYSWVHRHELDVRVNESDLALVRRVKKLIGWNGASCTTTNYGDTIEIRPRGVCQVCFIDTVVHV